ncbi:DUF3667 domain-containing protein [Lewinella sp. LCG006]|uniref:DUF3667 domain-containing protein n=1 Tax=Lewinella sp. LCG006 TaxID=3231911 RepID=UPI00345FE0D5
MASKSQTDKSGQDFRTCHNCYYPLPRFGQYCSHCGQKYTDGKITVKELIGDFLSNTLNLDAKIWRTLLALFVPGKLTIAFFKGRQQRYIRPLRLFFIFALVTIAGISFLESEFTEEFFLDVDDNFSSDIHYRQFLEKLDTNTLQIKTQFDPAYHAPIDSLKVLMFKNVQDSLAIGVRVDWSGKEEFLSGFKIDKKDIASLPIDSLFSRYQVETFWNKLILRQNIRLREQGENLGNYILNQTVWMMLVMMPILAFFLKIFYVRRSVFYVEHLIFSFHTHAFVFLMLTMLLIMDSIPAFEAKINTIWGIGLLVMEIYFFMALRRVYKQSRFKTFVKFSLLNLLYAFTFLIALIITILLAALLY